MAFSIESRVPLLDYRLIEFAFALDQDRKVGPGWSKHIMRQALDPVLPPQVTWRKDKKGFPTPFEPWADGIHRQAIRSLLQGPDSWVAGLIGKAKVEEVLSAWDQGRKNPWLLWRLMSLEVWRQSYNPRLGREMGASAAAPSPLTVDARTSPAPPQPLEVVITVDYEAVDTNDLVLSRELSIDWQRDLIQPTQRLARLLEGQGAKLTVMWDTAEYFWLREHGQDETAQAISDQLCDLVSRGHDVQLHLHPAWSDVRQEGQDWIWPRPGDTAASMDPARLEDLVKRSVELMNGLFQPLRPDYAVRGFRARGYEVEPFGVIAPVLKKYGIVADSSYHGSGPAPVRSPNLRQRVPMEQADFIEYPILAVEKQRWDFSGPPEFATLPLRALPGQAPAGLCMVMIGHSKQRIHYEELERCLVEMKNQHGPRLDLLTWQESIERRRGELGSQWSPAAGFDAQYFENRWQESDPFASAQVQDPYYGRLLALLPDQAGSLLDLGCAEGEFTARMASRLGAGRVLGVDISATAVERARAAHPEMEFAQADLMRLRVGERFDCLVSSQNMYYFHPAERLVILAHLEAMLASEGRILLAWWTGARRGYQEESIEEEFRRFFQVEHEETFSCPPGGAVKGEHRLLTARRRLSLAEEETLGALYWRGARVLCLSQRGADYQARFGWMCSRWDQTPGQEVDILICDRPQQALGTPLRPWGGLALVDGGDQELEGVRWVHQSGPVRLGARVDQLRSAQGQGMPAPAPAFIPTPPRVSVKAPTAAALREVVFVKDNPQLRIYKQALALKQVGGFKLTLIAHRLDPNLMGEVFDEIHQVSNGLELAQAVRARSPYIFHAHAEPNQLPAVVLNEAKRPMIYDTYDYAGLRNGVEALTELERQCERVCLEKAAGIVNKFPPEALNYYRGKGYQITAPILHYEDYCLDHALMPILGNGKLPDAWHIVHVGAVAPASFDPKQFRHMQFHQVARILDRQGIHFHIYCNPYQFDSGAMNCYWQLSRELNCFHFHHPVPPQQLQKEISQYHWGSNLSGHPQPHLQDVKLAIGNKFTSYLEAGLPIVAETCLHHAVHMINSMKVGVAVDWQGLKELGPTLAQSWAGGVRGRLDGVRRQYSISHNCQRLADFYEQVAG